MTKRMIDKIFDVGLIIFLLGILFNNFIIGNISENWDEYTNHLYIYTLAIYRFKSKKIALFCPLLLFLYPLFTTNLDWEDFKFGSIKYFSGFIILLFIFSFLEWFFNLFQQKPTNLEDVERK